MSEHVTGLARGDEESISHLEWLNQNAEALGQAYQRQHVVSRLRARARLEDASRRPEPRPDPGPADAPELSLADLCGSCGTNPTTGVPCGEECVNCGHPVAVAVHSLADEVAASETWEHVHGGDCDDPRPIHQGVTL